MKIDLELLKTLICRSIDDFIFLHGKKEIDINEDMYWSILDKDLFDMNKKPSDLGVGSLNEELSAIIKQYQSGEHLGSPAMQPLAAMITCLSIVK